MTDALVVVRDCTFLQPLNCLSITCVYNSTARPPAMEICVPFSTKEESHKTASQWHYIENSCSSATLLCKWQREVNDFVTWQKLLACTATQLIGFTFLVRIPQLPSILKTDWKTCKQESFIIENSTVNTVLHADFQHLCLLSLPLITFESSTVTKNIISCCNRFFQCLS